MSVPELDHYSGSWIVIDRISNTAVYEVFSRRVADKINTEKYRLEPVLTYLASLNHRHSI